MFLLREKLLVFFLHVLLVVSGERNSFCLLPLLEVESFPVVLSFCWSPLRLPRKFSLWFGRAPLLCEESQKKVKEPRTYNHIYNCWWKQIITIWWKKYTEENANYKPSLRPNLFYKTFWPNSMPICRRPRTLTPTVAPPEALHEQLQQIFPGMQAGKAVKGSACHM